MIKTALSKINFEQFTSCSYAERDTVIIHSKITGIKYFKDEKKLFITCLLRNAVEKRFMFYLEDTETPCWKDDSKTILIIIQKDMIGVLLEDDIDKSSAKRNILHLYK